MTRVSLTIPARLKAWIEQRVAAGEEASVDAYVGRLIAQDRAQAESTTSPEARQWLNENAEAIASWNAWVEQHGLPLDEHRLF